MRFSWDRTGRGLATLIAAAAIAAAAGCGKGGNAKHGGGFSMPPMPVETAVATIMPVAERFDALGSIEASDMITVVSEIDGVIKSLPFREGETIAAGGLIASLDDEEKAAEVARTEALRDQSRVSYDRIKAIVDQRAGAPQDLDDAAAALKVAEANLSLAQARLAKTRVTAPFRGILGSRRVSPGAFVRSGEPITDLARVEELRVRFSAPERYLGRLERGAAVTVSTAAYPGTQLTGRIEVIEPIIDTGTRSAGVLARVPNVNGLLRPGMSADISVILSMKENALVIPSEAVFVEGDQAFVYVVGADSTVARAAVALGTRLPDVVEVLDGVDAGAQVVRAGHQKIYPGAKVMPIASQPGAGAAMGGAGR